MLPDLGGFGKTRCRCKMQPPGLRPALILGALRGDEGPLFHGTGGGCELIDSLLVMIRMLAVT
jgi:hypothetical protein